MKREHQINFWYVIMAMFAVMFIQSYFAQQGHARANAKDDDRGREGYDENGPYDDDDADDAYDGQGDG